MVSDSTRQAPEHEEGPDNMQREVLQAALVVLDELVQQPARLLLRVEHRLQPRAE